MFFWLYFFFFFFFKQKTAYEMLRSLVGSEMCIRDRSYTGQDDQFWGHEWSKHGTCCNTTQGLKDQASFFGAALSFLNKAGLQDALKTGGVTPGASYAYNNMSDAIKAAVGVAPLMGCKTGNTLSEVGMCIDKASMKFTECDVSVKTQKGDEVSDCDQTQQVSFVSSTGPSPTPPSPSAGTCKAYGCGKFLAGKPCQCNNQCAQFDDCCPDYQSTCGSTPTPPTPPSDKCVSGELGPACSADSDCTSISNCIRCASSGHCTCVDKGTGRCAGGLVQAL
eukprot:TRINITY_DN423_c0_g1_i3.p1 TRINITY_DN423_c0_g1~~TRINITY_DN423_c0_g1_i3.p1  ORF type:complete len:278 (-),score=69.61 TRINITY_DN423_c0_g1_i3:232-1065(-)